MWIGPPNALGHAEAHVVDQDDQHVRRPSGALTSKRGGGLGIAGVELSDRRWLWLGDRQHRPVGGIDHLRGSRFLRDDSRGRAPSCEERNNNEARECQPLEFCSVMFHRFDGGFTAGVFKLCAGVSSADMGL